MDATVAYTWSKNQATVADEWGDSTPTNNVFNRRNQKTIAPTDQPQVVTVSWHYQIPIGPIAKHRFVKQVLGGWKPGGIFRYGSGFPIRSPTANNGLNSILFQNTLASRVPGQPLFLKSLDCHCINPSSDLVLNSAAWAEPAPGTFGTAAPYYSDYRYQRRASETMSIGEIFPIRKRMHFEVGRSSSILQPCRTGRSAKRRKCSNGGAVFVDGPSDQRFRVHQSDGCGRIVGPRSGQIVARFEF